MVSWSVFFILPSWRLDLFCVGRNEKNRPIHLCSQKEGQWRVEILAIFFSVLWAWFCINGIGICCVQTSNCQKKGILYLPFLLTSELNKIYCSVLAEMDMEHPIRLNYCQNSFEWERWAWMKLLAALGLFSVPFIDLLTSLEGRRWDVLYRLQISPRQMQWQKPVLVAMWGKH